MIRTMQLKEIPPLFTTKFNYKNQKTTKKKRVVELKLLILEMFIKQFKQTII